MQIYVENGTIFTKSSICKLVAWCDLNMHMSLYNLRICIKFYIMLHIYSKLHIYEYKIHIFANKKHMICILEHITVYTIHIIEDDIFACICMNDAYICIALHNSAPMPVIA